MGSTVRSERETPIAGRPLFCRLLGRAGFDRIGSGQLAGRFGALTWYAVGVVAVELILLQGYNLVTGRTVAFVDNPLWLLRPVILLGAALTTGALHTRYGEAIRLSTLGERTNDPEQFRGLVPDWLSWLVVGVGVGFTLVNAFVVLTIPQIYAAGGPARVVRFVVVTPLGYVPVLATFLATYASVEVLFPRRLVRSDVSLDYLDPENLGGMRPIGELVKVAYYFAMLGLIAYAVALYGPYVLEGALAYEGLEPPGTAVNIAFSAVWAAAVGTMAYGIYTLHRFMIGEKRETLHSLNVRARERLEQPWDIEQFDAANPPEAYERYEQKVDHVTATKEYPATFTMWTQLIVGVMLPKAIQLLLSAV